MAYSKEVVRRAQQRLAAMKADRESENLQHLMEAYDRAPRIREIDGQLRRSMVLAAQSIFSGADAQEAMDRVKEENLALQEERRQLAQALFAPGYLDEKPVCEKCGGSGYIGAVMCDCLLELCRQEQAKQLMLLADPNARFENFRLDYYSERIDPKYGASPRTLMEHTLLSCRRYADSFFGPGSGNVLLSGGTGLGKTFLSACMARVVAQKGYSVCYESAHNLFSKLEKNRFNPDENSRLQVAQIMDCDLLILDDLGTELPGNFVTAALYNLVNDRILANKPMIVSTNFNAQELGQRYSPQIASRLQGNFKQMIFVGEDIRIMKNRGF